MYQWLLNPSHCHVKTFDGIKENGIRMNNSRSLVVNPKTKTRRNVRGTYLTLKWSFRHKFPFIALTQALFIVGTSNLNSRNGR